MSIGLNRIGLASTILVVISASSLWAQTSEIDSLKWLVAKQSGTKKIDALNTLAFRQLLVDFKLANQSIQEALRLARKENYTKGLAESNIYSGICESLRGDKQQALYLLKTGLAQAKMVGIYGTEGYALTEIGNVYRDSSQYDSAEYWYDRSYQILKDSLNPLHLSVLYRSYARLYSLTAKPILEFQYLMKSYSIRQKLQDKFLRTDILVLLSQWYLKQFNFKIAKFYIKLIEKLDVWESLPEIKKDLQYQRATILFHEANFLEGLQLLNDVNEFYLKAGDSASYAKVTIDIADMLNELGNYELSLKKCYEALRICKQNNFRNEEVKIHFIMAWNYYGTKQSNLAKEAIEKTLADAQKYALKEKEASADNLIGIMLTEDKNYKEALLHFENGLSIRTKFKDLKGVVNILYQMGDTYKAMGKYGEAITRLTRCIFLCDSLNEKTSIIWVYTRASSVYIELKDLKKAEFFLSKADEALALNEVISTRAGKGFKMNIYETRRNILLRQGRLKEALQYTLNYEQLKDSLEGTSISDRILSLQASFEIDQRINEIKLLTKKQQVQQDQIIIQKNTIRLQQVVLVAIIIGFILLAFLAYLSYTYYRKKHKLNQILKERNEEIQAQAEELNEANTSLLKLNNEQIEKQEEVQAQAEELVEANQSLTLTNMELAEKSEEFAAQSEELTESNVLISSLNESLESKVTERTQELDQAYKELDTFFYRSSHDFRRPITTFMGLAEVAKITVKDANALDLFDKVKETAINLDRMLIKLQSISDVGAEQFVIKSISMQVVLEDACHVYHQEILDANIKVQVKSSDSHDLVCYPAFLKIIVENLLENSIRFRNIVAPQIILETSEVDEGMQLVVRDNGIGIEEIYSDRVFEMFFRGSEHSKGNGLGLYIVKKAVEKMRGNISFKSIHSQETTVTVWLPLRLA